MNSDKELELDIPVLLLVFNRIEETKKVFDAISNVKPLKLYIASDGPRSNKESEVVDEIRNYIISRIDWKCTVNTLFREVNLGCKKSVSSSIDWFFDNEECGIILEDDCLPSDSFFWFCKDMLSKYKDDMRIGMISGDNFQKEQDEFFDYYFSIYGHIWGWATWSDRWKNYSVELDNIENDDFIKLFVTSKRSLIYFKKIFKYMKSGNIDTWDYQWQFALWNSGQLTIIPRVNLVQNIGFGPNATHTTSENNFSNLKRNNLILKTHPKQININYKADKYVEQSMFEYPTLYTRLINKIKQLFHAL